MKRLLALAVGAVLLVTGCAADKDAKPGGDTFNFVSPKGKLDNFYDGGDRQPIPKLSGEDLMNPGKQLSVADYAGKVVVINLWGQWCAPCRHESPEMEKTYQQTKAAGVQVLGLDVQDRDRSAPQDFMRDRGLTYPSIYDPPGRSLVQLTGYPRNIIPSTIVVDKKQRVAAVLLRELLASDLVPIVQRIAAER
ncbi:TlpA disulfide reductase family protein [Amycolatopsis sp. CA-230715]|uniref:TlpA disulfide reductase family protein n=1 Tax=Amycolatopsis sp. CA-230715 TaxID=2745196 RepID=UPI001C031767|nr:TlpA disulfide reductase family protein [Amycolatopsis sp. CA-230715]QWF79881.1 Thiol-disulfide oxidoreductase ResA [Amycolatopsis sp. CA-230715]